jgi:hypothetical protein
MGNSPSQTTVTYDEEKLDRVASETSALTAAALAKDGSFRAYRRLKLERDLVCHAARLVASPEKQERCVDLQMQTFKAQWEAIAATKGGSLVLELFE